VNENLPVLLLRQSEGGDPAYLLGVPDLSPAAASAFQRLLEVGAVVHDRVLDTWDPCATCRCGAEERHVRWTAGIPVAICPLSRDDDEPLDPGDLQLFQISLNRLAELVGRAAGLDDRPEQVAPRLWRLGRLAGGRVLLLATSTSALRGEGVFDRLKMLDRSARFTLIANVKSAIDIAALAERGIDVVPPDEAFTASEPARPVRVDLNRLLMVTVTSDPDVLEVSPRAFTSAFGGRALQLEPRDARVLNILAREADDGESLATRDDLYRALVDRDDADPPVGDEQLEKSVSRIRGALCDARGLPRAEGKRLIAAVRGHGYRLVTPTIRVLIR
jgi:DNA-binding winged helix-turn-helix (wHTH) protein